MKDADPKKNGCPPDHDGDGILDPVDACPDDPGPADPDPKKNGCPLARIEGGQVKIKEQVKFKTGSADILRESDPLLTAVGTILKDHPELTKVRVEGHTDNKGSPAMNKNLSERRAASVVKWLTTFGIDKKRLAGEGLRPREADRHERHRRGSHQQPSRRVPHRADGSPGREAGGEAGSEAGSEAGPEEALRGGMPP